VPGFIEQIALGSLAGLFLLFLLLKHTWEPMLEVLARYSNWAHKELENVRKRELSQAQEIMSRNHALLQVEAQHSQEMHAAQQPPVPRQLVKQLVTQHARRFPEGKVAVGFLGETPLRWYVDLRDAVLQKPTRESLSAALAHHIREASHVGNHWGNSVTYSRVAVPEPGNQLLGVTVAEQLGVPAVIVKSAMRRINDHDTFDGIVRPGDAVILVDDVITSGAMIRESIEILRNIGATVTAVFTVISRKDPTEWPELASLDPPVKVFPILRLSDGDIEEIVADH
jgi:orotate phosphoribosyltransferase